VVAVVDAGGGFLGNLFGGDNSMMIIVIIVILFACSGFGDCC